MSHRPPSPKRPARLDRLDFHLCTTCGKRAYHSRDAAKAARKSLRDNTLRVYWCVDAGGFHLGHAGHHTREALRRRHTDGQTS